MSRTYLAVFGIGCSLLIACHPLRASASQLDNCAARILPDDHRAAAHEGRLVSIEIEGQMLEIPSRFLSWTDLTDKDVCRLEGGTLHIQFWFPGLHSTKREFWYRNENFVQGWRQTLDPSEQTVIKIQSVQKMDTLPPGKFDSAARRIANVKASYEDRGRWENDNSGLRKFKAFKDEKDYADVWVGEIKSSDIFINCTGKTESISLCTGFIDFRDLGISTRFTFSRGFLPRVSEISSAIRSKLASWIVE